MTGADKFELTCGLATAAVTSALSALVLWFDWHAAQALQQPFRWREELTFVILLFLIPGILVVIGSYVEASRRKWWGRVVIGLGCVSMVGTLGLFVVLLPFVGVHFWAVLNLSLAVPAFLTLIASFIPREV